MHYNAFSDLNVTIPMNVTEPSSHIMGSLDERLRLERTEPRGLQIEVRRQKYGSNLDALFIWQGDIVMQGIVDDLYRFLAYELGWPGSMTDVTVWYANHIWLHRVDYFGEGQCVLGDKGYLSSPYLVRPYDANELAREPDAARKERMTQFNYELSRVRVRVEQAYGRLKGRLPSLKDMATPADMRDVYTAVAALLVLHNVLIDIGDSPLDISTFDKEPDDDLNLAIRYSRDGIEEGENGELMYHPPPDHEADGDVLKLAGYAKRDALLDLIVPP